MQRELSNQWLSDSAGRLSVVSTHREPPTSITDREPSPFTDGTAEDRAAWVKLCNLQRRILPQAAPQVPGYQQVLIYRPAFAVTGDYHDFICRADGQTAVFVGDGSGHGPAASMLMAMMRTILHTHPNLHREPGETLTLSGRMLHNLIPSDLFMTGVYLLLGSNGGVSWSSAGHHPPLRVSRTGQLTPIDLALVGQVLGFASDEEYVTVTCQLWPGDRLLLFTDGLWEARNRSGEAFGRQRLFGYWAGAVNLPLHEAVSELVAQVTAHLEGAEFEDDFTVVGIERQG
jgi:sigma-B regulation protein RsbU (phosphoserine phosphatase)